MPLVSPLRFSGTFHVKPDAVSGDVLEPLYQTLCLNGNDIRCDVTPDNHLVIHSKDELQDTLVWEMMQRYKISPQYYGGKTRLRPAFTLSSTVEQIIEGLSSQASDSNFATLLKKPDGVNSPRASTTQAHKGSNPSPAGRTNSKRPC